MSSPLQQRVVVLGGWAPSLTIFRGPLLAAMTARGHRVTAMASEGSPEIRAELAAIGVDYEELPLERTGTDPRSDARAIAAMTRRLRAIGPDVVLGYTIKPVIYGGLAGRLARIPRRYAMITGLGYAFLGQERLARRALRTLVEALYRAGLRGCDAVFFQNPDDRAEFAERRLLPSGSRVEIVRGSGVDVDHFAVAPLPAGPPTFLYIGRLHREKGILEFIEMARLVRARRPDVRFCALGWLHDDNPSSLSRAEVDRWVADGVIEFLGDAKDVRPVIAACHVFVLPSYREGTPRSVLEAMSMGRPVITTDVPGCRETVIDGDNGLLVPPRDPAALADAAFRLLDDPTLAEAMGRRGRARAEDLYDARKVAAQMLEVMGL